MKALALVTVLLCAGLCLGCGGDDGGDNGAEGGSGGTSGQSPVECNGPGSRFVTGVVEFEFGPGQDHGQDTFPAPVLGPPSGGGCCKGSLEVTSLGDGGFVVLEFAGNAIVDGPGADFIVFENAFLTDASDPSSVFEELAQVSVSQDGTTWHEYPCTATAFPFDGCAGWHPVAADPATNDIDPLDPAVAGGDAFDLADLGLDWARYVRIDDRNVPADDEATFDLDAVGIVNAACP